MDTKVRSIIAVCSLTLLLSGASGINSAGAAVILPGNHPQTDENVLFNEAGLIGTGPTVQGITNNTNFIVTFTGDGETLTTPAGGQARIEALDHAFDFLRVEIVNGVFRSIILNLDALAKGSVAFTTDEVGSAPVVSSLFALGNGSNFFTLTSLVGFEKISLATDVGVTAIGLADAGQFRIGGVTATPEPASLVMWSLITLSATAFAVKVRRTKT